MEIKTERLILHPWREEDLEPFAAMCADPKVMEFFPSTLTQEESDQSVRRYQSKIEELGFGLGAASLRETGEFVGFIGLNALDKETFPTHFSPCVEIGWRLSLKFWGKGLATEGALACLSYGFENLDLSEIVAFTAVQNLRSRSVMERIGMHRNPADDFDHPKLESGHWLQKCVLYRLER